MVNKTAFAASSAPPTQTCPACDSSACRAIYLVHTNKTYDLLRCDDCRLIFASPRPSEAELRDFYTSGYFSNSTKQTGYQSYNDVGEDHMRKMWPVFCSYAGIHRASPGTILDVGCATGGFLLEAERSGWKTKGVDLAEDAVQRATQVHGLDVELGDLDSVVLEPGAFEMATMWHVLEHLIDPLATLRKIRELLAPGGHVFIELPNWNSLGRIVRGQRWSQILPPAHINYFTPSSLGFMARQAGFDPVRVSTHYVAGFDRLQANPRLRWARPIINGMEGTVGLLGYGAFIRLLARKPAVKTTS